jgi:fucose permease
MRGAEAAAFGGMLLFGIVVALLGAVLPLVSAPLGLGLGAVGNLFLALNGAVLAGSFAFGLVVDRFGYRGALTTGPLLIGTALVLVSRAGTPLSLAGAVALLGLGGSALNSATNALVADLHPAPGAKAAALNRLGAFFGLGALLLPLMVGTLLQRLGLDPLLLAMAGLSLAVGLLAAGARYPAPKQPDGLTREGLRQVVGHPLVLLLAVLLFFQAGSEMLLSGYLTTFLTRATGASVSAASLVLSAFWVALIAARFLLGRLLLRVSPLVLIPLMAGTTALALALVMAAPGFASAAALLVVAGFALSGVTPSIFGVAGAALPGHTGTVIGLMSSLGVIGAMILPWAGGHLAAALGVRAVMALGAAGFTVVLLLALAARRVR